MAMLQKFAVVYGFSSWRRSNIIVVWNVTIQLAVVAKESTFALLIAWASILAKTLVNYSEFWHIPFSNFSLLSKFLFTHY